MKRFWDKVEITDRCWNWQAAKDPRGYGRFQIGSNQVSVTVLAHRFAYELVVGELRDEDHLHHLCHNPSCVRPDHFEVTTAREHPLRHPPIPQTHCKHGHEFTEENTLWLKNPRRRSCRSCSRERMEKFRAAKHGDR